MIPGMIMAWLVKEPLVKVRQKPCARLLPNHSRSSLVAKAGEALMVLGFISLYKLGDSLCTTWSGPGLSSLDPAQHLGFAFRAVNHPTALDFANSLGMAGHSLESVPEYGRRCCRWHRGGVEQVVGHDVSP